MKVLLMAVAPTPTHEATVLEYSIGFSRIVSSEDVSSLDVENRR